MNTTNFSYTRLFCHACANRNVNSHSRDIYLKEKYVM